MIILYHKKDQIILNFIENKCFTTSAGLPYFIPEGISYICNIFYLL